MSTGDGNEWVTAKHAAATTGVSVRTIREWMRKGKVPAINGNGGRLVRLADIEEKARTHGNEYGERPAIIEMPNEGDGNRQGNAAGNVLPPQVAAMEFLSQVEQRMDQLYREQIAARDTALAAKDQLIEELQRRASQAETEAATLRQQLAGLPRMHETIEQEGRLSLWRRLFRI